VQLDGVILPFVGETSAGQLTRVQLIIEAFQLPLGKQSKVSSLPGSSNPALQLNLHKSPTTLV